MGMEGLQLNDMIQTVYDSLGNLVDVIQEIQTIDMSGYRSYLDLMRWLNECENNLRRAQDYCNLIDREVWEESR